MVRRFTDYTAQMQAAETRRRLQEHKHQEEQKLEQRLLDRQATNLGRLALDIRGPHTPLDTFAGQLLEGRDRAHADPELEEAWAARGRAYFRPAARRRQPAKPNGATGNASPPAEPPAGELPTDELPADEPARPRPAAPAGSQDLLDGLGPARPGADAPAEDGDPDEPS